LQQVLEESQNGTLKRHLSFEKLLDI
jgi:hypothetical protein